MEPVRIVIIGTQFVETSPLSFKSVVQSLTGKDSCLSWVEESSYKSRKRRRTVGKTRGGGDAAAAAAEAAKAKAKLKLSAGYRSSFKEWDGLMFELPPAEEMRWVWGD